MKNRQKVANSIFIFLFLLFFSSPGFGNRYVELGVCAIFKDDVKYLPEWIEFHEKQGVEHFWLYNNGTGGPGDYYETLAPYIESGLVEVKEWPFRYDFGVHDQWIHIQNGAYEDCMKSIQRRCKWLALIDTDEFLFCPTGEKLRDVMHEYIDYPVVAVRWALYGTSGVGRIPEGEKMTDLLLKRADLEFSGYSKSVVQPRLIEGVITVHAFTFHGGGHCVDENMEYVENPHGMQGVTVNRFRINHYVVRDLEYLENVKVPMIKAQGRGNPTPESLDFGLNVYFDDCIRQFN